MKAGCFFLLVGLLGAFMSKVRAQVDGSGTEISASTRMQDYLQRSQYPETNRLLHAGDTSLFETPLLPGDARTSASILAFSGEKLQGQSLQIFFRVRVQQAGLYSFRTHLISDQYKPLLEVLLHQKLTPGEHTLYFFIYGKAIRDSGSAGPFDLPGIVGEKLPPDGVAENNQQGALLPLTKKYRTQKYRLSDFTSKAWDSPEKRATIRRLRLEIRDEQRSSKKTRQ